MLIQAEGGADLPVGVNELKFLGPNDFVLFVHAIPPSESGSRGEHDDWSDLDLHVAIFDEHLAAFWADRERLYQRIGQPVLVQREMPSNAQPGGHFQLVIFDGPLEVDWSVGPRSVATRAPAHVLLLGGEDVPQAVVPTVSGDDLRELCQERLIFPWAMAPSRYIARGQTSRAVGMVGLVSGGSLACGACCTQVMEASPA